jgi:glutamate/aspartate transport system substrate-binding protein
VDEAVLQLLHSGEIFQVYERWFDTPRLRIPLSIHMRENIRFPNKCGIP